MRRPHVFQRSRPQAKRLVQGAVDRAATAHTVAVQLGHIIDKVDQAGLSDLGDLLEEARIMAERAAGE